MLILIKSGYYCNNSGHYELWHFEIIFMEIKELLRPLKRWWWLILGALIVAAAASFLATLRQPPMYLATTTLMIGGTINDPNPSSNEFYLTQQLAATYADIAMREPVRNSTQQALGLNWLPAYSATALTNSQVIEITVTDTIPERAQAVAAELANQLILRSPTSENPEDAERQQFIQEQLDNLQVQIKDTTTEIDRLQGMLGDLDSAREISDTQAQITALQAKRSDLQSNYSTLLSNSQRGAVNTITIIDPANLPNQPIGPNRFSSVLLAAALGLVLATTAAYVIEYLDDTLKTPEEIKDLIQLPVIGYIGEIPKGQDRAEIVTDPHSRIGPAFRYLRTNIAFADAASPIRTILVTSADPEAGKTTIAVNLAFVMAQTEKKVVLIDADFHRPNVHTLLGINNRSGLSDIFRDHMNIKDVLRNTKEGNLTVLTTGTLPPNPTELLASEKMDQFLDEAKKSCDLVVIDSSPFIVADAAIMAAKVDAVLWVVRAGHTRRSHIKAMKEQVMRTGARIVGVVVNGVPESSTYYTSYYRSAYYDKEDDARREPSVKVPSKKEKSILAKEPQAHQK